MPFTFAWSEQDREVRMLRLELALDARRHEGKPVDNPQEVLL